MKPSYNETTPAGGHELTLEDDRHASQPGRPGFFGQIPAIVLTAAIVIGATAWMRDQDAIQRAAALEPLHAQNEALQVQSAENRREIEATTQLLKDAMARQGGALFHTDEEVQKLNDARITLLADAIAKKVIPAFPPPKSAAELEQLQNDQVDKVAARFTDNLRPILSGISEGQKTASAQVVRQYEARVQRLDQNLQATQAAAQDALKLANELSALYLDSFKDQGVLVRLMSLPASLVIDTAKLNLITSRDRAKEQARLSAKMNELDQRLHSISTVALASQN